MTPQVTRIHCVSPLILMVALTSQAWSQHGDLRNGSTPPGSTKEGSANRGPGRAELALRGYCPVCLVHMKEWIPGDPRFTVMHDGKAYRFPRPKELQMFRSDPVRYTPALGGDNIVHFAQTGERVAGSLSQGITHGGRLYFVGSRQERAAFQQAPSRFANADLALGGDCVVSRVNNNQTMPGSPETTVVHHGMRYRFAGLEQQRVFLSDPAKYEAAVKPTSPWSGSR